MSYTCESTDIFNVLQKLDRRIGRSETRHTIIEHNRRDCSCQKKLTGKVKAETFKQRARAKRKFLQATALNPCHNGKKDRVNVRYLTEGSKIRSQRLSHSRAWKAGDSIESVPVFN